MERWAVPKVPIRDITIYYEEAGSGSPLLLITGLGADLQGWANTAPALAKTHRVITFDNRGAGRTSAPDRPYAIDQMAEDAAALIDALGVAKAHVLGFSMGGAIALELALNHPGKVDKLILLSTLPRLDGYGRSIVRNLIDVRRSNMSREQIVRLTGTLVYSPALLDDPARLEGAIQNSLRNPYPQQDHAFIRQATALLSFDVTDRLKHLKQEALVVTGTDDVLVPPRNSRKLAELVDGAKLVELQGGHVGAIEYAADYNTAFLEFLGS
jgi:pimeloyl-ACP methyl ester carboxylesterase